MKGHNVGFLHPGAMGVSLAASALNSGYQPHWVSAGRSAETRSRAEEHGLREVGTVAALCEACEVIVSVCPPHAALDVAHEVAACGFDGLYADVNAISPDHTREVGRIVGESGAGFVDGGIIGGPAWKPGETVLHLSGPAADRVAACFAKGPLMAEVIGAEIGRASALKMCFAANSKGTAALLGAVVAAAERLGVLEELEREWDRYDPGFSTRTLERLVRVTAKAWRFSGEMAEIAATLESAGLPGDFHRGAEEVYRRMSGFKGASPLPNAGEVIGRLQNPDQTNRT